MNTKINSSIIIVTCGFCLSFVACDSTSKTPELGLGSEISSSHVQQPPKPVTVAAPKQVGDEVPSSEPGEKQVFRPSLEYPKQLFPNSEEIIPSNGSFAEQAFKQAMHVGGAKLPLYHVEVDTPALMKAVDKLQSTYGDFRRLKRQMYESGPDRVEVYAKDNKILKVNYSSGWLSFTDVDSYQMADGVKELDVPFLQKMAKSVFKDYLGDKLDTAYLYRFREYHLASSNGITNFDDGINEVAFALNQNLDGIPLIGSGGKYSIHLQPDGTLVKADFHFVKFVKVPNSDVEIFGSQSADKKLRSDLYSLDITLDDHKVSRSEFGYFLPTSKGKIENLVPAYAYFVKPSPGVIDKERVFTYPASESPRVLDAVRSDEVREENRKTLRVQVKELPEDVKPTDPTSGDIPIQ